MLFLLKLKREYVLYLMENLIHIVDATQINKIFETIQDKLIVLMFYTKNNPDCKRAKMSFEKVAANNNLSIFCLIDVDKFQGESRYVTNISTMPSYNCYYMCNSLGTFYGVSEKEIDNMVRSCQQYVITQNNMKSGSQFNNQQLNQNQIQQQILNNAMMQNPLLAQQFIQNPMLLQQYTQKYIQSLQQQQMMQQTIPNTNGYVPYFQPQMSQSQILPQTMNLKRDTVQDITNYTPSTISYDIPNSMNHPMNAVPNSINNPMPNSMHPMNTIPNDTQNGFNTLPTMQQMQQMFQIFQMMQQMGILNIPNNQSINKLESNNQNGQIGNEIILPNGEKLISLSNGKYGLIKKVDKNNI